MLTKLIHCPGADIRQRPSERAYASTGMRFLTVVVHKLPEAVEACRTGGGRGGHEPSCYEGGLYCAFVADPDGNEIELAVLGLAGAGAYGLALYGALSLLGVPLRRATKASAPGDPHD